MFGHDDDGGDWYQSYARESEKNRSLEKEIERLHDELTRVKEALETVSRLVYAASFTPSQYSANTYLTKAKALLEEALSKGTTP